MKTSACCAPRPRRGHRRAVIEAAERAVGLVLRQHTTRAELDQAGLFDLPTDAIDIHIVIGEPDAVACGIGPQAIAQVAELALEQPDGPW